MMIEKPTPKTGIRRIWAALFHSLDGLRAVFAGEAAFRQELFLVVVATAALPFLPLSFTWKGILFLATAGVLVIELLNSAIESVVDLVSPEYHPLAGRAKDAGSAAVLLGILIAGVLWAMAIGVMLFPDILSAATS
uniref:Diacylglycerol kinase n=1 Tax=Candidatus Kentrum sp. DK TaxID=2126562 RepID=A0A450TEC5_9GAMM|nr:MAG: diacylglycerol kinase [Candidatus Kentron sp. DK]VFJ65370.1 MAG: diacylglycerol kinase [Candidatus Kentron sp. DK]